MDPIPLEEESKTYENHKKKLLKENASKYVLIKGNDIIKIFISEAEAIHYGINKFGNQPFLVKKIEEVEQIQKYTSTLIMVD